MKVRNIAFSGFAAAILAGVSGAHAADPVTPYNLATTDYVTKHVDVKQDKLGAENAAAPITISVDAEGKTTIGANLEDTLAPYAKTEDVETTLADYATKADLDGALDEGGALTEAVDTAVNDAIQEAVTSGEIGNAITNAVADKADTSYVDEQLAKKQGLMVAGDNVTFTTDGAGNTVVNADDVDLTPYATNESVKSITDALDSRVTTNADDITGLKTADTQLGGRIGAIESAGYQTASDVETALAPYAKSETVAATYATKGEIPSLEGLASQEYAQQQAAAAQSAAIADAAAKYATTGDLSAVSGVANAADALSKENQGEINTLKAAGYQNAQQVSEKIAAEAVTSVGTGSANGMISVNGTDVPVYGLGSAAYTSADAYDTAGAADAVQTAIDGAKYVSGKDVAAGTYLITTDGAGTYTWTSVKIVNE